MIYILSFLLIVLAYQGIVKKDWTHPIIYFFGVWSICILLNIIDLYDTMIPISDQTIIIIGIGVFFYWLGILSPYNFRIGKKRTVRNNTDFA